MNQKDKKRRQKRRTEHNAQRRTGGARLRTRLGQASGERFKEEQKFPLAWRPWHFDLMDRTDILVDRLSMIQVLTGLPNPADFPASVGAHLEPGDLPMLRRYVKTARALAKGQVLNLPSSVTVKWKRGKAADVTESGPPDDAVTALMVNLRQMLKGTEEASFERVRNAVAAACRRGGEYDALDVLKRWKTTQQALRKTHYQRLEFELLFEAGVVEEYQEIASAGRILFAEEDLPPAMLIETYTNGEELHWGEIRDKVAEWEPDDAARALMRHALKQDAETLAHFYASFAGVVERVVGGAGVPD